MTTRHDSFALAASARPAVGPSIAAQDGWRASAHPQANSRNAFPGGRSTRPPLLDDKLRHKDLMERTLREMRGFAEWSPVPMSRLLASSRLRWHRRGDLLSAQAEAPEIFAIVTGHAMQVDASQTGNRLEWVLCGSGSLLGFCHMFDLKNSFREYIANDDVVAIHIPGRLLFELLDDDPVRWKDMGPMLMKQEREQMEMASGQVIGALPQRLAWTIEQLAALRGTRAEAGATPRLRLTQQDLATLLRVDRHSVHRTLAAWAATGMIKVEYNAIAILDAVAFRKISHPSIPSEAEE